MQGQASTHQRALTFQSILEQAGIPCTIRLRRGIDIQAGCGQLAGQNIQPPRDPAILSKSFLYVYEQFVPVIV